MAPPQVGSQFAGYRIESLVGRGGMGVVYRARQPDLDRSVALKLIAPEALEDAEARRRFVAEARHAAAIEHPNVVPIYAAGESEGVAYFVMRFVEGDDLRTRVRRTGPLPPRRAAEIAGSVGAALDAIHRAGLVHRDVKPANILLGAGDHVYLTDFGLARAVLARGGTHTGAGRWAGSLHYAAPEQIRGGRIDARADIYALGGVLFFMLSGHVPYERDSDEATLWAHIAEPPPRPSVFLRGLPRGLDEVVDQAMAKLPGDRYQSAGDLARAAVAAAARRRPPRRHGPVAQGAASPSGAIAVAGLSEEAPTLSRAAWTTAPALRRRAWPLAGVGALVAAAMAAGLIVALTRGPGGATVVHGAATTAAPPPTATAIPTPTATTIAAAATAAATATPAAAPAGPHVGVVIHGISHRPNGILRVGRELWISSLDRPLLRVDARTGTQRAYDPDVGPGSTAFSRAAGVVWTLLASHRRVLALSAATGSVMLRLAVPYKPVVIAADRDGGVWVGVRPGGRRGGPDRLIHYDRSGHMVAQGTVRDGLNAIAVGDGAVWVALTGRPRVARYDPSTARRLWSAGTPGFAHHLVFAEGSVWASCDDGLARIDPADRRPRVGAVGHGPQELAVARGLVFVAALADSRLDVLDARTMQPAHAPLRMPLNPWAVTADSRHVWVTSVGEDAVTRVDVG